MATRKKGKELPKKGNSLPCPKDLEVSATYESLIATALRRELGGTHKAVKTLMRWTGASERTAKNWLTGAAGPNGPHLISLIGNSEAVFAVALKLAGRDVRDYGRSVTDACALLTKAMALLNHASD